jgi:hypothetical protein
MILKALPSADYPGAEKLLILCPALCKDHFYIFSKY